MLGRVARLRVGLDLDTNKPLFFLARTSAIGAGIGESSALFPTPSPSVAVLLQQIQDATAAQANVGKIKGAAAIRNAKFAVLRTSMESERMMVQALCDANPEQAEALIAAASMVIVNAAGFQKPLLGLKNILPSGGVALDANATLLDGTRRCKTFNWQGTLDNGKTFFSMPSTPTGKTSIAGLTPLTTVGFQVSVTVHKQPQGPWSQTVSILVR
jgi:hypothetical protein